MKLCILGPLKRKEDEIFLIKEAKKNFGSVLYVPYEDVSICGKDIYYKNTNLSSFDIFLPRIKKNRSIFGYIFLSSANLLSPISSESYMYSGDRFLLMKRLGEFLLPVPKLYFFDSVKTARRIISEGNIEYPLALRTQSMDKIMFASSQTEVNAMMDALAIFKEPIYVEEFYDDDYYKIFIVGEKCVLSLKYRPNEKEDIYLGKGVYSEVDLSSKYIETAKNALRAIKSNIGSVSISKKSGVIINIELMPSLYFQNIKKQHVVAEEIIKYLNDMVLKNKRPDVTLTKFVGNLKTTLKDVFKI